MSRILITGGPLHTPFRLIRNFCDKSQIWGCERADARSHLQIWGTTTEFPRDHPFKEFKQGAVLIQAGKIQACGAREDIPIPEDCEIIGRLGDFD